MADITVSGLTDPLGKPRLMDVQGVSESVPFPIRIGQNGGVGFEFTGGLITVQGTSLDVRVTFDRAMVYDGDFTPVPGGVPFQISQPTLDTPTLRVLTIPVAANQKPNLVSVTPNNAGAGVLLAFDSDITATAPSFGAASGKLSALTATLPTTSSLQLGLSVAPPILTEVAPNATGLLAVFDVPMAVSGSLILDPPYNGLIATGATVPLADRIQYALTVPQAGATATTLLLSCVATSLAIVLTFNKDVALTASGSSLSAYTISTSTPGAVVPTITSVTVLGAVVTLHTTEQTNGATYVVDIAPGSIIATS
jgi:hypothetical protein